MTSPSAGERLLSSTAAKIPLCGPSRLWDSYHNARSLLSVQRPSAVTLVDAGADPRAGFALVVPFNPVRTSHSPIQDTCSAGALFLSQCGFTTISTCWSSAHEEAQKALDG